MRLISRVCVGIALSSLMAGSSSASNIALSNDDGWDAPGIQAVKHALVAAGHNVTLAAPLDQQSGSGTAVDFVSNLVITKERVDQGANEFSVAKSGGTEGAEPATSALIAIGISTAENGAAPDLLVMGTNSGANIGAATQISGTVGGSIVSIANGLNGSVPAIAISTDEPCDVDDAAPEDVVACEAENEAHYANVADFLAALIAHLETKPGYLANEPGLLPPGLALNVNHPPLAPADILGVKLSVQGRLFSVGGTPLDIQFVCFACGVIPVGASSPGGIGGAGFDPTEDVRHSDVADFNDGYITVVPIEADYTAGPRDIFGIWKVLRSFDD